MQSGKRQTGLAEWVTSQRGADYTLRAASMRVACVLSGIVAFTGGHGRPWGWAILAVAALGVYLSWSSGYYEVRGREPRELLARRAKRSGLVNKGKATPNLAGLVEGLAALTLPLVGSWSMINSPVGWRLLAVAAAAGFIASVGSAVFLDPAWYTAAAAFPVAVERVRSVVAPLAATLTAAGVVTAPWPGNQRWLAGGVCLLVGLFQLRVRETDRAFALGAQYADQRQLAGRTEVAGALHTLVGNPLIVLRRLAVEYEGQDPLLWDMVRQVEGGYRESLALEIGLDVTADWPGVLVGRLDAISGQFGILVSFNPPDEPMSLEDRQTARLVLDDLTMNSAKAGSTAVAVSLQRRGERYVATVRDDAPPFPTGSWLRVNGGLRRLQQRLAGRGGELILEERSNSKTVTASWRATPTTAQEDTS